MFGTRVWDSCPCVTQLGKIYHICTHLDAYINKQSISRMISLPARQFSKANIYILCIFNANTEHCVQSTQHMQALILLCAVVVSEGNGINVLRREF
jgi:hypothetical protein